MKFTAEEKEWIEECKENPGRYQITVDNDCISVDELMDDGEYEGVFTFNEFGYDFIVGILKHIGCNADLV